MPRHHNKNITEKIPWFSKMNFTCIKHRWSQNVFFFLCKKIKNKVWKYYWIQIWPGSAQEGNNAEEVEKYTRQFTESTLNFSVFYRLRLNLIKHWTHVVASLSVLGHTQNNDDSDIKNNIINTIPVFFFKNKRQSTWKHFEIQWTGRGGGGEGGIVAATI